MWPFESKKVIPHYSSLQELFFRFYWKKLTLEAAQCGWAISLDGRLKVEVVSSEAERWSMGGVATRIHPVVCTSPRWNFESGTWDKPLIDKPQQVEWKACHLMPTSLEQTNYSSVAVILSQFAEVVRNSWPELNQGESDV